MVSKIRVILSFYRNPVYTVSTFGKYINVKNQRTYIEKITATHA